MRLAKLEEKKCNALKKNFKNNAYKGSASGAGGVNSGIEAPQKAIITNTTAASIHLAKKLTQQELRERRERGLCFSCD